MTFQRIAIIGLGLLGGSIGLALNEHLPAATTTGYDAHPATRDLADEVTLSARAYWQAKNEADTRPYHPSQLTSDYTLINLRLDVANIGGSKANLAAFITNATNNRVCQPESAGVLGSSPQGTFGVVGTSGVLQCLPMAPRMVGTTLSFKF